MSSAVVEWVSIASVVAVLAGVTAWAAAPAMHHRRVVRRDLPNRIERAQGVSFAADDPTAPLLVKYIALANHGRIATVNIIGPIAAAEFDDGTQLLHTLSGKPIGSPFNPDDYRMS